MIPNVLKQETMPNVDRTILHEAACRHVEERFKLQGEVEPTWALATGNHVVWIETPWDGERMKVFTVNQLRKLMRMLDVHCYCQMTEAWLFSTEAVPEEDKHWIKHAMEYGLQDIPDRLRDDVAQVFSFDKDGNHAITNYKVTLRRRGLNFLGPRMDNTADDVGKFSGRMWNLLRHGKDK
jgi:hypothetical protein